MSTEEFCGGHKGTHWFKEGSNQCKCGRAFLRAPRPSVHVADCGVYEGFICTCFRLLRVTPPTQERQNGEDR